MEIDDVMTWERMMSMLEVADLRSVQGICGRARKRLAIAGVVYTETLPGEGFRRISDQEYVERVEPKKIDHGRRHARDARKVGETVNTDLLSPIHKMRHIGAMQVLSMAEAVSSAKVVKRLGASAVNTTGSALELKDCWEAMAKNSKA